MSKRNVESGASALDDDRVVDAGLGGTAVDTIETQLTVSRDETSVKYDVLLEHSYAKRLYKMMSAEVSNALNERAKAKMMATLASISSSTSTTAVEHYVRVQNMLSIEWSTNYQLIMDTEMKTAFRQTMAESLRVVLSRSLDADLDQQLVSDTLRVVSRALLNGRLSSGHQLSLDMRATALTFAEKCVTDIARENRLNSSDAQLRRQLILTTIADCSHQSVSRLSLDVSRLLIEQICITYELVTKGGISMSAQSVIAMENVYYIGRALQTIVESWAQSDLINRSDTEVWFVDTITRKADDKLQSDIIAMMEKLASLNKPALYMFKQMIRNINVTFNESYKSMFRC